MQKYHFLIIGLIALIAFGAAVIASMVNKSQNNSPAVNAGPATTQTGP